MTDLARAAIAATMSTALGILCVVFDIPGGAMVFGFFAGTFATTAVVIHAKACSSAP